MNYLPHSNVFFLLRHTCLLFVVMLVQVSIRAQLSVSPKQISECVESNSVTVTATLATNMGDFNLPNPPIMDPFATTTIGIGFDFNFFGTLYSSILLSENNFITFLTSWEGTSLPNYFFAYYEGQLYNSILFPFQDLVIKNNSINNINTITLGDEGDKKFLVEYCTIELDKCSNHKSSSQVVLHEGTNIIDIHIFNKPMGCSHLGGTAVLGIIGPDAANQVLIPGYDQPNTPWTLSNVSFRFTPQPDGTYTWEIIPFDPILIDFNPQYSDVSWAAGSNPTTSLATGQTFDIPTPNTEDYYICTYESTGCDASNPIIYRDTVWLTVKESDTTLYDTICEQNMEDFLWHQHTVNATGNHTFTFITPSLKNSCDSTVVLKLRVNPTIKKTDTQNACINNLPSDAATYNNNQAIVESGVYQYIDIFPSVTRDVIVSLRIFYT